MKKVLLIYFLLLSTDVILDAQIEKPVTKGHYFAGGSVRFNNGTTDTEHDNILTSVKLTVYELSPNLSYFVLDRLATGLQLNFSYEAKRYDPGEITYKENYLLLSAIVRYYIFSDLFGEIALGSGLLTSDEDKGSIVKGNINVGYTFFLNENIGLEPIISLVRIVENSRESDTYHYRNNKLNFSLSLQTFF
jgi:hypothetical protein